MIHLHFTSANNGIIIYFIYFLLSFPAMSLLLRYILQRNVMVLVTVT